MAHPLPPARTLPALRLTFRRGTSSHEGIWSGYGKAAREPDRLFLVVVSAAAASVAISPNFDPDRGLRLRVGFDREFASPPTEAESVVIAAGVACAVGLRPRPSSFAKIDRRSE